MNKFKKYITVLLFTVLFSGCGNFLDIKPVNSMIPVSIQDFESVLLGGYPKTDFFMNTEYLTDNVYSNPNTSYAASAATELWYGWASTHQADGKPEDAYWGEMYKMIYYANSVMDELKSRTPSVEDRELYERVMGEAYAMRAYAYFYLINLYADVYSPENLEKPGVPLALTALDVNETSKDNVRVPIGKVWEQIVADMNSASDFLAGKAAINRYRFDYNVVQLFKARVYLFMRNYEEAIKCTSDVINTKLLFDMNSLQAAIDEDGDKYTFGGDYSFLDSDYNKEILFFIGGKANNNIFYYEQNMLKTSPELLALCDPEGKKDYRKYIFASFLDMSDPNSLPVGPTVYRMYANQGQPTYYIGFKLSEAYVTRAECYARLGNKEKAIEDINTLLVTRFKKGDFTAFTTDSFTDTELLTKVLNERRLEMAFEGGLRWFDLRRLGKPALTHSYKNGIVFNLKQNDPKYILQIPVSEQEASPNMPLNPR